MMLYPEVTIEFFKACITHDGPTIQKTQPTDKQ